MGRKILLIDEDPNTAALLDQFTGEGGFNIITAHDGMEGLQKARTENPDLIIMDTMLRKLDGFNISRFLKFDGLYKNIPIIMLTARADPKDEKIAKEVGADVFLTKPVDGEKLLATIEELLGGYSCNLVGSNAGAG